VFNEIAGVTKNCGSPPEISIQRNNSISNIDRRTNKWLSKNDRRAERSSSTAQGTPLDDESSNEQEAATLT
jgi:hypothetical protein